MTTWRDIKGFEGFYQASDEGQIGSVARDFMRSNGRKNHVTSRILKACLNDDGYLKCALPTNGKLKSYRVHRLVALAFLGDPNDLEVNHKDGNKTNNKISNLEYVTHRENVIHSFRTGLQIPACGSKVRTAKLKEFEIPMIRKFLREGCSCRSLARLYGMDKDAFQNIKKGVTWRNV